ncbi:MAG: 5-formyltetrahydrofolate cyclo-ligase [Actinomycetia bacterium]|nr:5-formyltetrahydrofolate cyclo-ligase [Actinomycetes bacterium]
MVTWRPLPDEPDPTPVEVGLEDRLALTRTPEKGGLTVHPAYSPREEHPYGFEQPAADSPVISVEEIAVVLVPGLAFDRHGIRLGRGAGYFDRFLADLPASSHLVGVCAEARMVDRLPREPHDIPMTHLLTEAGLIPPPRAEPSEGNNSSGGSR